MPAIAAAPVFYAALASGAAGVGAATIGAKAQSGATKRSLAAQTAAQAKAEAFEREQDALNRAEEARQDAEDKRRYDIQQQNETRDRAERDMLTRDTLARQQYDDQIRYRKMVNLARLTGQPAPPPMPQRSMPAPWTAPTGTVASLSQPSAPIMSAPSRANAMIAQPDAMFDPLADSRLPMSRLVGRRR